MDAIHSPRELGRIIRGIRKEQGVSQKRIADPVGVRQATVSKIENDPAGLRLDTLLRVLSSMGYELCLRKKAGPAKSKHGGWKEEW